MYCKRCGNFLKENERFCPNCGEKREENSYMNNNIQIDRVQEKKSNKGTIAIVLGILSFVIPIIGLPLSIIGLILGIKAKNENNGRVGMSLSIIGLVVSIFVTFIFVISSTTVLSFLDKAKDLSNSDNNYSEKYDEVEDEVEGYKWKGTDGSMLYLYEDGHYEWYKSDSNHTDNYYKGSYFIYENEEAIKYIDEELSEYGLTSQEQYDLIDRASASYYKIENYMLLGLNCTERFINGSQVYAGLGVTPYYGFYNKNYQYLDIANMKTASYVGFYRNEELENYYD